MTDMNNRFITTNRCILLVDLRKRLDKIHRHSEKLLRTDGGLYLCSFVEIVACMTAAAKVINCWNVFH
jgi:hypothetical protein